MTNHTPQELLEAWMHHKPVFNFAVNERLINFSDCTGKYQNDMIRLFIFNPEQFTLTDPNQVEEAVAGEALLDAFFSKTLVRKTDGEAEILCWSKCDNQKKISALLGIISNPEWFSIRGNKPVSTTQPKRPQVGQALTLENLRDVEFMRRVKRVEWNNPITDSKEWVKYFANYAIVEIIVPLTLGWTVTITEVVEGE